MESLTPQLQELKGDIVARDHVIILAKRELMQILSDKTLEYLGAGSEAHSAEIISDIFTMYETQIDGLSALVDKKGQSGGAANPEEMKKKDAKIKQL